MEEQKDEVQKVGPFFGGYWIIIKTYSYYFLGIIVIFSLLFALLPEESSSKIFSAQLNELRVIRSLGTGNAIGGPGFFLILQNNLGVLALTVLFSFIFGAGAIYVITWNASIIGVLIGVAAKEGAGQLVSISVPSALPPVCESLIGGACSAVGGPNILVSYMIALPCSILSLIPHGIFEITAYFMAGLVGGIVSTVSISNKLPDKEVVFHTLLLLVGAITCILIGAIVEAL
ncbi:stage II sporulation protein M [archaeon]|nr:stage II sporulation protein M [archaeon]